VSIVRLKAGLSTQSTRQFYNTRNSSDKECRWFVTEIIGVCVYKVLLPATPASGRDSTRLSRHLSLICRHYSTPGMLLIDMHGDGR